LKISKIKIKIIKMLSSKFNKILLVKKTTKYERMKQSGRTFSPYIENVLMKVW